MLDILKATFRAAVESFPTTSVPATVFAAILSYIGCSGEAFILWAFISALDMVFGVILAIVDGVFKIRYLYRWVSKVFIQLLTIALFAAVLRMFALATGVQLFFASWLLLFFTLMDFSSIMEKFLRLGYLPKPAQVLLSFMRRRAAKVFAAMVNEPELEQKMRDALGEKDKERELAAKTQTQE